MDGIIAIIAGVFAIVLGIFGKDFYEADGIALHAFKRKSSLRSARIVCFVVAALFIAMGIGLLLPADR